MNEVWVSKREDAILKIMVISIHIETQDYKSFI